MGGKAILQDYSRTILQVLDCKKDYGRNDFSDNAQ
jgi:hypothetical protein